MCVRAIRGLSVVFRNGCSHLLISTNVIVSYEFSGAVFTDVWAWWKLFSWFLSIVESEYVCTTSAFGGEPPRMLSIIQRFGKYCNCHLQGECVVVGRILEALYRARSTDGIFDIVHCVKYISFMPTRHFGWWLHIHLQVISCHYNDICYRTLQNAS
jgi:hypothetical protein